MLRQFRGLILGAPGSGKGTISSRIIRKFDIKHIASGDILRHHILNGTDLGKEAKSIIDEGKLLPDDVMMKLMLHEITGCRTSWLLDGFPRTLPQAKMLFNNVNIDAAISLVVPFDIILSRIKGRWIHPQSGRVYNVGFNAPKVPGIDDLTGEPLVQRDDDKPEAVRNRLDSYSGTMTPVINFYKDLGILEEFSGNTSDEIWPLVNKFLLQHITPSRDKQRMG